MADTDLLRVVDLTVSFPTLDGLVQAVRGVSFTLEAGKTLGVVGESGSGKSVSMQTLIGLTSGAQVSGRVLFEGRDLLKLTGRQLQEVRGAAISMIFQDPLTSLHPYYRVGWQIAEVIRAHTRSSRAEARSSVVELLRAVGIPEPDRRLDDYPHQFSGGMRQRAMIAMGLALNPKVLIADEPTTALDVTVQAQIIDLLRRLQHERGMAIVLVTHDLGVIAEFADDVLVMYAGKVVEQADRRTLFYRLHHPYTRGLVHSLPSRSGDRSRLNPIVGQPPSPIRMPEGCAFHPRCPFAMERCLREEPELMIVGDENHHRSACWLPPSQLGLDPAVDRMRALQAERAQCGPRQGNCA